MGSWTTWGKPLPTQGELHTGRPWLNGDSNRAPSTPKHSTIKTNVRLWLFSGRWKWCHSISFSFSHNPFSHFKIVINLLYLLWHGHLNKVILHLSQRSVDRSAQCKLCGVVIAWCWRSISCLNPGVFLGWPERYVSSSPSAVSSLSSAPKMLRK